MKKLVSMIISGAMLYKIAKKYGIHSFKDAKLFLKSEVKDAGNQVKEELVA